MNDRVAHHIVIREPPAATRSRGMKACKFAFDKSEFKNLVANAIVHRSNNPGASRLHMFLKKNSASSQSCRALNAATHFDGHPIQISITASLEGTTAFRKSAWFEHTTR